jgi:hypothetical protein
MKDWWVSGMCERKKEEKERGLQIGKKAAEGKGTLRF